MRMRGRGIYVYGVPCIDMAHVHVRLHRPDLHVNILQWPIDARLLSSSNTSPTYKSVFKVI